MSMSTGASQINVANQWRRFNFFEVTPITDPNDTPVFQDPDVISVATGAQTVFLGTRDGRVKEFSRELTLHSSWQAQPDGSAIDFMYALPDANVLVTVSFIQNAPTQVTFWNTSKKPEPKTITNAKVSNGHNQHLLTAFSCSRDGSVLAFGYADGAVIVLRGDMLHDRGSRQRVVCTLADAITGVHILDDSLFVVSLQQVLCVSNTGNRSQKVLDKTRGASLKCSALFNDQLVISRDDGITFYHTDHRGASQEFPGQKKALYTYGNYLVLITAHRILETETYRVVIVDTRNDLIAYDGQIALSVRQVFVQWHQLNIIGSDGVLYVLREKQVTTQLEILKQQKLFPIAIKLAENANADEKVVMGLHQDYGDYLEEKGNSELALKHYILAINLGDTSHVIMRYKDSHKVTILAEYLKELVAKGLATSAHLTLLLVCYTNLRQKDELARFVKTATDDPNFDFSSAVQLCRNAKYYDLAAYIAEKQQDPDLVVQIKLRDLHDYQGCLDYITTTSVSDALWVLTQNSRILLDKLPVETTSILITLFTGKYVPRSHASESPAISRNGTFDSTEKKASTPLLQSYKAFMSYISSQKSTYIDYDAINAKEHEATYQPPRPALIFPSFIGHNNEFVIFLEACLEISDLFQPGPKDMRDIVTTLYQVYLSLAAEEKQNAEEWQGKAENLISQYSELLDANMVLMVAKLKGIELRPDQLVKLGGSYTDIFRHYLNKQLYDQALAIFSQVSQPDDFDLSTRKEILSLVLETLCDSKEFFGKIKEQLTSILTQCITLGVASPVQIVQTVCKSPFITVGDMKPFMLKLISSERTEIDYNSKIAKSYREEIDKKQQQIHALTHDPLIIQHGTCSFCSTMLDLPAIHFACKHSYHQRCLGDSVKCPLCLPELESVSAVRSSELEESAKSGVFFDSLADSKDPLRVISDYVSRGALAEKK